MLQTVFTMLLACVLVAAVLAFAVMGLLQHRRSRRRRRQAAELGLRFAAEDPFDIPRRYADFTLAVAGHSPRANNVVYGRLEGRRVRLFDFRYEIGHGSQRTTRCYDVLVLEGDRALPTMLMWNDADAVGAPLETHVADGHLAHWTYQGERALVGEIKDASLPELAAVSLQACGWALMIFAPCPRRWRGAPDPSQWLAPALEAMRLLESRAPEPRSVPPTPPPADSPHAGVANPPAQ